MPLDEQIVKSIEDIETNIKKLQEEKAQKLVEEKKAADELKRLGDEQVKIGEKLAALEQKADNSGDDLPFNKTLGDLIAEKSASMNILDVRGSMFEVETKALTSAPSNTVERDTFIAPYERPGMITHLDRPLFVEQLFPHVPINADQVLYVREGGDGGDDNFTNNAAARKEGEKYQESTTTAPKFDRAIMQNIGHFATVTVELLQNATAFAAYINQKMVYGLQAAVENQLLSGDGSATNIKGILATGNNIDKAVIAKGILEKAEGDKSTLLDFIFALKTVYETRNYFSPTVLVLTPEDWALLQLMREKEGSNLYALGGPQSLAANTLWGMRVVTCYNEKLKGKYLMLNPNLAATIYERQAVQVATSYEDAENFKSKLVTIRVDRTLGLSVDRPFSVYYGDFAVPSFA